MDSDAADDARLVFIGGLIAALAAALVGLLGPHDGSLLRLPGVLQHQVERSLEAAGAPGVEVAMRGQRAVLAGVAATADARARAGQAALTAAGHGGAWAGGVTAVDLRDVKIGPAEHPFEWRVTRVGEAVTLSGAVPSEGARTALLAAARQKFPNGRIEDHMHVAGGAPAPGWRRMALDGIEQLATLAEGEARFVDTRLLVIGSGARAAVQAVRAHYQEPAPAPFEARADLTVTGEPLAIPELSDLDLTNAGAQTCAEAFNRLMAHNVINFASNSAELNADSLPLLNNLASVALRCDRFNIEVAGHTDNAGAEQANLALSR
ncbi:MAG: hypothetical protein AB7L65_10150, partial [Hyphomonadaceae bacterium]